MPIYTYECETCGERFEAKQSFSDAPLTVCPTSNVVIANVVPNVAAHPFAEQRRRGVRVTVNSDDPGMMRFDIADEYAAGRPAAWVDDNIDESCREWALSREEPTLIVETASPVGLTDAGIAQARRLGEVLRAEPLDLCITSQLERTRVTADLAGLLA